MNIFENFNRAAMIGILCIAPALVGGIVAGNYVKDVATSHYEQSHTAPLSEYQKGERDGEARILGGIAAGVGGVLSGATIYGMLNIGSGGLGARRKSPTPGAKVS